MIKAKKIGLTVSVTIECPFQTERCQGPKTFVTTAGLWGDYIRGIKTVQEIWPTLSAEDRERFITGVCPGCWDDEFEELQDIPDGYGE